jgi:hypothetical protein
VRDDGGLNYHEIVLGRRNGKTTGIDIYVYSSGERLSQTMRRMAILGMSAGDTNLIKRLRGTDSEFSRHAADCAEMTKAFREQRFADCVAAYERLSPNLQKEKAFMLYQVFATQKISDEKYVAAIDAFRAAHPKEACADLIAIDSFAAKKQFDAAIEAVERLDRSLGGDPHLHLVRANLYFGAEKFDDADLEAKAAIAGDATLINAQWVRVTISLNMREFDRTAELLTAIQRDFGVQFADLTTLPDYAEFVKSPEYKKWLAGQPSNP